MSTADDDVEEDGSGGSRYPKKNESIGALQKWRVATTFSDIILQLTYHIINEDIIRYYNAPIHELSKIYASSRF